MIIKQDGKQEIHVCLETVENDSVYTICDSTIDYPRLFGGEWVNSTEHNGEILRLSISASNNFSEWKSMNGNKYIDDWGYNPQHMEYNYPYGNNNTSDDLLTMLYYN